MGNEHCVLLRMTSMGVGNPYLFPPPKAEKWIAIPLFRALDKNEPEDVIREYQPSAKSLRVRVENCRDLARNTVPTTMIQFGENSIKNKSDSKKTRNPIWTSCTETWNMDETWREHSQVEFHLFKGKSPMGMALYELGTMRLPFAGPLRLRPSGQHRTARNIHGQIIVSIDVLSEIDAKEEEEIKKEE